MTPENHGKFEHTPINSTESNWKLVLNEMGSFWTKRTCPEWKWTCPGRNKLVLNATNLSWMKWTYPGWHEPQLVRAIFDFWCRGHVTIVTTLDCLCSTMTARCSTLDLLFGWLLTRMARDPGCSLLTLRYRVNAPHGLFQRGIERSMFTPTATRFRWFRRTQTFTGTSRGSTWSTSTMNAPGCLRRSFCSSTSTWWSCGVRGNVIIDPCHRTSVSIVGLVSVVLTGNLVCYTAAISVAIGLVATHPVTHVYLQAAVAASGELSPLAVGNFHLWQ